MFFSKFFHLSFNYIAPLCSILKNVNLLEEDSINHCKAFYRTSLKGINILNLP